MPPTVSFQGKCRPVNLKNRKGDQDLGWSFLKLRVYFDGLVNRNKVLSQSIHRIETNLGVVAEVLKVQSNVAFELCIDEDFIKFWWADLMFESPHDTIFYRISTLQWREARVIQDHSGRILGLWWIFIIWWGFRNFNLIHHLSNQCCEFFYELIRFLIRIFPGLVNRILDYD